MSKNIFKKDLLNKFDLFAKIPFRPLPQYSNLVSLTDTAKDISLFSM